MTNAAMTRFVNRKMCARVFICYAMKSAFLRTPRVDILKTKSETCRFRSRGGHDQAIENFRSPSSQIKLLQGVYPRINEPDAPKQKIINRIKVRTLCELQIRYC